MNSALDELVEYRAPARWAIAWSGSRARVAAIAGRIHTTWNIVQPWLAGATLIFVYLLAQSWMENARLSDAATAERLARADLEREVVALRTEIAEAAAMRPGNLFFLIEGDSIYALKEKLQRLSMMVAAEHFRLQESTRRETK